MSDAGNQAEPKRFFSSLTTVVVQLTTFVTALTALIAAVVALWNAATANSFSVAAKRTAQNAANTTAEAVSTGALHGATPSTTTSTYVVQLATYQTKNCLTAQEEIDGYHGAFSPPPKLLHDPTGRYVIIGITTSSLDAAKSLQEKARQLAQEPSQSGNDLGNALVRINPPWTPLASCP